MTFTVSKPGRFSPKRMTVYQEIAVDTLKDMMKMHRNPIERLFIKEKIKLIS